MLILGSSLYATSPKREMRSAWVATVWALDWPASASGSWITNAQQQKTLLIQMLDSLHAMNMNCIALHGRPMSDAFYNSKYEPWSQWVTGTRGETPSYDPMAFAIEEAHKRGMEVHVWINPYRYASSATQYNTNKALPNDYANTHPEWLMTVGDATILNPGLPAVKTRICEVIADIMEKYDVDGFLFDDYFYLSGTPNSMDAALYNANNPDGLSQADWRREQVNEMVRRVQDTILVTKPWVTFGIGPAPQVASSAAHAAQYDVPVGPFSDWQYNSIYSDPLAWMSRRTIDYISPQMYWHVGSSTCDFSALSQWWSMVAEKYGRHFYASHSVEDGKGAETVKEVNVLREDDRIDAAGSVLYSIRKAIYKSGYVRTMRNNAWQAPALPPQKWWRRQNTQLFVSGINYQYGTLKWNAPAGESNVRYAVYYIPNDSIGKHGQFYSSRYLLGMTYGTSYSVPQKSNYSYAVSVLDRYGNEYAPVISGFQHKTIAAPVITYPTNNSKPLLPTYFTWQAPTGADSYFIEIARDSLFDDIICFVERGEPRFFTGDITLLEKGKNYWWRVTARGANADDVTSAVCKFTGSPFAMVSPKDGAQDQPQNVVLVCDSVTDSSAQYKFELATKSTFEQTSLIHTGMSAVPRYQVPDSVLSPATVYYARASVTTAQFFSRTTPIVFRTAAEAVSNLAVVEPHDGDVIYGSKVVVRWTGENAAAYRAELSTLESFAPRVTKGVLVDAYTHEATLSDVAEGDYFIRIRATGDGEYVYSDVISITVKAASAVDDVDSPTSKVRKIFYNGNIVIIMPDGSRYTVLGTKIDRRL